MGQNGWFDLLERQGHSRRKLRQKLTLSDCFLLIGPILLPVQIGTKARNRIRLTASPQSK